MKSKIKALTENEIGIIAGRILVILLAVATVGVAAAMYVNNVFDGAKTVKFNAFMGLSLAGMIVATCYIAWLLIRKKGFSYERLYLVLAISLGISMQIVMPCFSCADENVHFLSAYNASNIFTFDIIDDWHMYMRQGDGEYYHYFLTFPEEYELLANGNWVGVTADEAKIFVMDNANIFWPRYVVTGLGIFIARLLHLGLVGLMYAGRMMNTLLLVVAGYFCVKITPYGKAQMVSLTMLPLFMEMCNSYSYDINSIMLALVFSVLCIYYAQPESKFRLQDVFLLFVMAAFLLPNKAVYVLFIVMLFVIPWSKWKGLIKKYEKGSREDKIQKIVFAVVILIAAVLGGWILFHYFDSVYKILFRKAGATIETVGGAEAFSMSYILSHPGATFGLIWSTWKNYGWSDFLNVVGAYLGNHKIAFFMPDGYIIGIIVALVLGLVAARVSIGDEKNAGLSRRQYIIWIVTTIVVLLAVYLGSLLRFTPIEGTDRVQVSFRYYLPIFVTGLVMTGTNQKENKLALSCLFLQNIFYTMTMCYVLQHLITL